MTYTVTVVEEVRHTFRIRVREGQCVNWRTGREKFHVSNRYRRNPANLNWLN